MTELFFVAHNAANVDFGNRILNTLNGAKLLSFSVSILYVTYALFLASICPQFGEYY